MSSLDYYSKILYEWKQKRNEDAIAFAEIKGMFEAVRQMSKDNYVGLVMKLAGLVVKEAEARKDDVLTLNEIMLHLAKEMAGDINVLKSIVESLASEKKALLGKVNELSERLEQREEILTHLDNFLKEKEEEKRELKKVLGKHR